MYNVQCTMNVFATRTDFNACAKHKDLSEQARRVLGVIVSC